jgi:flagellar hook-basal body complex protein FliE
MIDLNTNMVSQNVLNQPLAEHLKLNKSFQPKELQALPQSDSSEPFGNLIGDLVKKVDEKGKAAVEETNRLLLGETDNIHQSMIAMQESGLAFTMLVEVRNKLVQSYQELMKMPV